MQIGLCLRLLVEHGQIRKTVARLDMGAQRMMHGKWGATVSDIQARQASERLHQTVGLRSYAVNQLQPSRFQPVWPMSPCMSNLKHTATRLYSGQPLLVVGMKYTRSHPTIYHARQFPC